MALGNEMKRKNVVLTSKKTSCAATTGQSLVMERLTKEKAEYGSRYVNLLSTMGVPIIFRKVLTTYSWGGLVHDAVYCSNALTGGPLDTHLRDRSNRLVFAQMLRECHTVRVLKCDRPLRSFILI